MVDYTTIYLSPHLDDAALSCGGQIFQQTAAGQRVLIVTLMAGDPPEGDLSPYATTLHARWQLGRTAVAARRQEDQAASATLGAEYVHWDIADCIYRRALRGRHSLYTSDAGIFGAVHPADEILIPYIQTQLAQLPTSERMLVPLTVGRHVDHQLTHEAAVRLYGRDNLFFYEDYPYAQTAGAVDAVIQGDRDWQAQTIPVDADDLAHKCAAIAAYTSQLGTFFTNQADLERQVFGYAAAVGGERIWTHKSQRA